MKVWFFRTAAVLLGLAVCAAAELVCVAFGWGRATEYDDPFVGFSAVHPLFVLNEEHERYEIPKSRRQFFAHESFSARKRPNGFRIFCLGGSTVQGRPFSKSTSFTTWLELSLTAADPSRDWDVVNCGGISYASYRLVPILEECLAYEPDLFIICCGHNEFLEERTYDHIKHAPVWLAFPQRIAARLRSYTLLRQAVLSSSGEAQQTGSSDRPELKSEVDALLDYHGGLRAFSRNDRWRAGVIEHYEHNLRRMIAIAGDSGVPVILMLPPSNLRDCPPFKSQHREGLANEQLAEWRSLMRRAQLHYRDDLQESVRLLQLALRIDERYASAHYELGKCYDALGLRKQALDAYIKARDEDICPLRILSPMEEALERVAHDTRTPFLDANRLLEDQCSSGMLGDYLLIDHIHPSFEGHQIIATALTELVAAQGWVRLAADWQQNRERAFRDHFASLENFYFLKGQRTLDNLRAWTQGRADGPPIEQRLTQP